MNRPKGCESSELDFDFGVSSQDVYGCWTAYLYAEQEIEMCYQLNDLHPKVLEWEIELAWETRRRPLLGSLHTHRYKNTKA